MIALRTLKPNTYNRGLDSIEFVDLFLTPLNFTEFSGRSPLNSPELRKIPQNRVCIE